MKILFLRQKPDSYDYLSDSIYHGLITSGYDVFLNHGFDYMYKSYDGNIIDRKFTLYKTLDGHPNIIEVNHIVSLIFDKFFDKIIISDMRYYNNFYNDYQVVFNKYKKCDIHLIDGTDDPFILSGVSDYATLWKRELLNNEANPISFSIPKEKIIKYIPKKEKLFGYIIPGDMSTYIFNDEKSYYDDYAKSYYGITFKKGGWDCLRHYEILANGCIPYFTDLENCPVNTMVNFPKKIIKETNKYAEKSIIHPSYDEIVFELLEYTRKNLTTKSLVDKIINY